MLDAEMAAGTAADSIISNLSFDSEAVTGTAT